MVPPGPGRPPKILRWTPFRLHHRLIYREMAPAAKAILRLLRQRQPMSIPIIYAIKFRFVPIPVWRLIARLLTKHQVKRAGAVKTPKAQPLTLPEHNPPIQFNLRLRIGKFTTGVHMLKIPEDPIPGVLLRVLPIPLPQWPSAILILKTSKWKALT